jgi:excisionase family DNA binding protein
LTALLTTDQTAERLGVSPRSVQRLIAAGELPVVRIGRSVRVDPGVLATFVRLRRSADSERIEPANTKQKAAIHVRARVVDEEDKLRRRSTHDRVLREASMYFGREITSVNELA